MSFLGLILHFFLLLKNIPLYKCTIVCLPINLLRDIVDTSIFGLLWIKLLYIFIYRLLCVHKVSTELGKHQACAIVGLYGKSMFSLVRNYQNIFPCVCSMFHPHQQWMKFLLPESLSAIGINQILDFNQSKWCVLVSHCFNLQFSNDK